MHRHSTAAHIHAAHARANRRGIVAMIAAMGCFVANDALVKYVSESLPAAQLIFVRGVMATALVIVVAATTGALRRIRKIAHGWVVARAAIDSVATMLFLVSLFHLPLPTAAAINMASPLIISALAAALLGERLRASGWVATAVGFVGVLLIVQPQSEGFSRYALVCLLATLLMSVRDLVTRRVHAGVPSLLVTLANSVAVTLLAGAIALLGSWSAIAPRELALVAVAAVLLASGYLLLVTSTRRGSLSVVAPFRYSALLFATILGFVVWGDVPNLLAWCGIALVVGSGIQVLRASRRARTAEPAPE
jgi:drug/metabolite transporter (DMT)-like permease